MEDSSAKTPVRRNFGKYLLFSFIIAWVLMIVGCVLTLMGNPNSFRTFVSLAMFAPLVSVIITSGGISKAKTGIDWKPHFRGNVRWWLLAWLGFPILTVLGTVLYYAIFPSHLDPTGTSYLGAQVGAEAAAKAMAGMTPALICGMGVLTALTAGLINIIFTVGEEAGWRGYMYPYLKSRLGKTLGRIVGGTIWGVWHWPVMLLVGYEYNLSVWNAPWYLVLVSLLVFCVFTISLGTILDVLYEKTGCIWVAALGHGILNAGASLGFNLLVVDYANEQLLGPSPVGLIGGLPMLIAAVVIWVLTSKKAPAKDAQ